MQKLYSLQSRLLNDSKGMRTAYCAVWDRRARNVA